MKTDAYREAVTCRYYVVLLLFAVLAAACKKTVHPPVAVPEPVTDARNIRLKQVFAEKLPSPYFFFNYDVNGFVDSISYASGFFIYQVSYKGNRVASLLNKANMAKLVYEYKGVQVSSIVELNPDASKFRRHLFAYDDNGKLKMLLSYLFNTAVDSVLERRMKLNYYADGNLASSTDERRDFASGILTLINSTEYLNYDAAKNVDDFYLLKDAWGHLLFLPQVKFQVNNAGKILQRGVQNDYEIINTYLYNDNGLPLVKNVRMEQIRGSNVGVSQKFKTEFTYY